MFWYADGTDKDSGDPVTRWNRRQDGSIRRRAFLDAASEVAGHWNDRRQMVNQYAQAQRSAERLQAMALELDQPTEGAES